MLLQGASMVRIANGLLAKNKHKRDFVLMALYLDNSNAVTHYTLFQNQNEDTGNGQAPVCG